MEHVIALFRTSAIEEIITVVGHHPQALLSVVQAAVLSCLIKDEDTR